MALPPRPSKIRVTPKIQRGGHQLAHAKGAGAQGVALRWRQQRQASGFGHFNQRGFAIAQHGKARQGGLAQRALHLAGQQLAAGGADQRIQRAFAAIGQRQTHAVGVWPHLAHPLGNRLGGGAGRQAFLEAIRADNDFHQAASISC